MIVGLIPARGGSKGIPGKNLAECAGKPLIWHTCEAAKRSALQRVIVSTDSTVIASAAKTYGVEAPFLRPPELSGDDTPMISVLQHALAWLENSGQETEAIALLQPTSPLRTSGHIDAALALFRREKPDSVVSVVPVQHRYTPGSLMELKEGSLQSVKGKGATRRQDKPALYARNGPAIAITRADVIRAGKIYGDVTLAYEMSELDSIDVDTLDDLKHAELLLRARR